MCLLQNEGFCLTSCTCWPVLGGSILLLVIYLCATIVAIALTASLFSRGITSSSFLKGGGYWLLSAATVGFGSGALIGGLVSGCVAGALTLGSGFMLVFSSLLLVGKRCVYLLVNLLPNKCCCSY